MSTEFAVSIIRTIADPTLNPDGSVTQRLRVDYKVGTQGPFSVWFPAVGFSGAKARQEIDRLAQEIRVLHAGG